LRPSTLALKNQRPSKWSPAPRDTTSCPVDGERPKSRCVAVVQNSSAATLSERAQRLLQGWDARLKLRRLVCQMPVADPARPKSGQSAAPDGGRSSSKCLGMKPKRVGINSAAVVGSFPTCPFRRFSALWWPALLSTLHSSSRPPAPPTPSPSTESRRRFPATGIGSLHCVQDYTKGWDLHCRCPRIGVGCRPLCQDTLFVSLAVMSSAYQQCSTVIPVEAGRSPARDARRVVASSPHPRPSSGTNPSLARNGVGARPAKPRGNHLFLKESTLKMPPWAVWYFR
jgi:hypothetical protein